MNFRLTHCIRKSVFLYRKASKCQGRFPGFFIFRGTMRELGIFVDESGSDGLSDRHYLPTVAITTSPKASRTQSKHTRASRAPKGSRTHPSTRRLS